MGVIWVEFVASHMYQFLNSHIREKLYHSTSLVPRLSLFLPLDFVRVNIMHENLKERESLVQNHTYPWPSQPWLGKNSIEKGHRWAQFRTRLSLSF